ncbi:hypothetical protein [Hoeflea prorocentri]|uniref:N-acetyltransferase domain-containing protein n=1 Tax=Hoeflea prorocentri TaxID=1922333 RepID=A0A9X3UPG9_9HYPH|nr:hypothetical protein [Hoeflea prorocentri]MCY6382999.1 hypothetical protein [Hoeflea prorocentri]MDA5400799.1 hypothetical protein [Hoeflea prorocentri]
MSETSVQPLSHGGSSLSIYRDAPSWDNKRTAALGKLKIGSVADGVELFLLAAATLRAEGFEALLGPMEGDTWHSYRAVTESDGSPAFLMEPTSGDHDVAALGEAGFDQIDHYVSMRVATKNAIGTEPENPDGIDVVNWDGESPEAFFGEVYDFSVSGFAANAYYKPITREAFLGLYMPYVPFLRRELIFFARAPGNRLAGFLFGIPDYSQGPDTKTAILKTYASGQRGVGHLLADAFHRKALETGFDTVIHALMHADNVSRERSRMHGAEVFRRYTLFGRVL